ncbi:MAG TPA: gamma carbonic anhydrase family protein [Fusibacter sp.]|nr:gamma carbonic anhydrase family protein [Fusibacter sp.]
MLTDIKGYTPVVHADCFIADSAAVIGQVRLEQGANIWYNTVVRGDVEPIDIGENTNIQDLSVIHTSHGHPVCIGNGVTVGHRAICHGCTIEDNVLIGMGAIVLDGAHIESDVVIGAGSLVPPNKRIPSGSLVMGSPAKVVRALTEEEIEGIKQSARGYVELSQHYKSK